MDEAEQLDLTDGDLAAKLNLIAQKVAEEQRKVKAAVGGVVDDSALVDPANAFICEGCQ
jgi:hypothetical protein